MGIRDSYFYTMNISLNKQLLRAYVHTVGTIGKISSGFLFIVV